MRVPPHLRAYALAASCSTAPQRAICSSRRAPRPDEERSSYRARARRLGSRGRGGRSCMQQLVHEEGPTLADVVRRALAVAAGTPFRVEGLRGGGRAFFIAEAHRRAPAPF